MMLQGAMDLEFDFLRFPWNVIDVDGKQFCYFVSNKYEKGISAILFISMELLTTGQDHENKQLLNVEIW